MGESIDRNARYRQVREALSCCGPLTAKEVAVWMYDRGYVPTTERNHAAPRITELEKKGEVMVVGAKVCQYTGKKVFIYALKEK